MLTVLFYIDLGYIFGGNLAWNKLALPLNGVRALRRVIVVGLAYSKSADSTST